MQGRVKPHSIGELQLFPVNNWLDESIKIYHLGFNNIEILWDKLQKIKSFPKIHLEIKNASQIQIKSICVDSITILDSTKKIIEEIQDIISFFGNLTPSVLVIPLLGKVEFENPNFLKQFMYDLSQHPISNTLKLKKISLCLEVNLDADYVIEAFNSINNPLFSFCLDSGNLWTSSKSAKKDLISLMPFVKHVHIKDKDIEGRNVMLGKGIVDFEYFFEKLEEHSYSGLLILETNYFTCPENEASKNLHFLKKYKYFK